MELQIKYIKNQIGNRFFIQFIKTFLQIINNLVKIIYFTC